MPVDASGKDEILVGRIRRDLSDSTGRSIYGDPNIAIGITCVRIPVLRAHCVSVTFECEKPITPEEVRAIISKAPGCRLVDDQERNYFPMPVDASGKDEILVGRIRRDLSDSTGARSRSSRPAISS